MICPDRFNSFMLPLWAKGFADRAWDDGYFAGIRTEIFDEAIACVLRRNDDARGPRGCDPQHGAGIQTGAHLAAISFEPQVSEIVDGNNHRAGAEERNVVVRGAEDGSVAGSEWQPQLLSQ